METISIQVETQDYSKIANFAKNQSISVDELYNNFTQSLLNEQKSFENFQKIANTGSRQRGLALVKKLQQIHGDN